MIEMVLAGADKWDLVKMIDKEVVKRQEAIFNVVETGEDCEVQFKPDQLNIG